MDDFIQCVTIAAYCVENNDEDIKRGEPKYLGFVFNVKSKEAEYMRTFIMKTLDEYNVPFDSVDIIGRIELPIIKVWSKERIINAIKKDAEALIRKKESKSK